MVVLSRYDGYTNNSEAFEADTLGQHVELNDLKKQVRTSTLHVASADATTCCQCCSDRT